MRTPVQYQQNYPRELAFSEAAALAGADALQFRIAGGDAALVPLAQVDWLSPLEPPGADLRSAEVLEDADVAARPIRGVADRRGTPPRATRACRGRS